MSILTRRLENESHKHLHFPSLLFTLQREYGRIRTFHAMLSAARHRQQLFHSRT